MRVSRLILFLLLAGCVVLQAAAAETGRPRKAGGDSIVFRNGDVLFGGLSRIDWENGIHWNRPDALNTFVFSPERVAQLDLAVSGAAKQSTSSNLCTVQLHNGDQLEGDLLEYDGEQVVLETWYAGKLTLPKSAVALIVPLGLPKPILFAGPDGLEDWTMGRVNLGAAVDSGEWHYQDGAFYAIKSASIARDVNLPDSASFQFDLEWRGFFHIAVALHTEYLHPINLQNKESEPKFGGFYSLQLNPFAANLLPVKQTEPQRYLGQASLPNLAQTNRAHVDIRVSKAKRLIALLVNGTLIKQWLDEDFAGTGTAVRFVNQGQGAVKLSNIKVTEWDGQFEEPLTLTTNKTQDLARLKNGDRVIGTVQAIREGKLNIDAGGTKLDVPINRVKQVELASAPAPASPPGTNTVRAFFARGAGSLTFNLESWTKQELAASSDNFGAALFDPTAFSRILFDLTNAPAATPR